MKMTPLYNTHHKKYVKQSYSNGLYCLLNAFNSLHDSSYIVPLELEGAKLPLYKVAV